MKVVIPSKGRPDGETIKMLKQNGFPEESVFVVIRKNEWHLYEPNLRDTNAVPVLIDDYTKDGKPQDDATTRNEGLNYVRRYFPNERYIAFVDDDIIRVSTKDILVALNGLTITLEKVQEKHPKAWFISAKPYGPFLDADMVYINKGTPWVTFCVVDILAQGSDIFEFYSTKEFGPQEISVPVLSASQGGSWVTTTVVLYTQSPSLVGGISDVIESEERSVREQIYYESLKEHFPKYVSLRHSRTLGIPVCRCNFAALKRDFGMKTNEYKIQELFK